MVMEGNICGVKGMTVVDLTQSKISINIINSKK